MATAGAVVDAQHMASTTPAGCSASAVVAASAVVVVSVAAVAFAASVASVVSVASWTGEGVDKKELSAGHLSRCRKAHKDTGTRRQSVVLLFSLLSSLLLLLLLLLFCSSVTFSAAVKNEEIAANRPFSSEEAPEKGPTPAKQPRTAADATWTWWRGMRWRWPTPGW